MEQIELVPCVGCGALVPDIDGPTHRYLGASPGCWRAYGELQSWGYRGTESEGTIHRLAVDAYAAQHPGVPGKQSSQSVMAHLYILCRVFERDLAPAGATDAIRRFVEKNKARTYPWLEPPQSLGPITVLAVLGATTQEEHDRRVMLWAESVWQAWQPHHNMVRRWADEA